MFQVEIDGSAWWIKSPQWPGLQIGPLVCCLSIDGQTYSPSGLRVEKPEGTLLRVRWVFNQAGVNLIQEMSFDSKENLNVKTRFENPSNKTLCLNKVVLMTVMEPGLTFLGTSQEKAWVYEDNGYSAHVRQLSRPVASAEVVEQTPSGETVGSSQTCWEVYNPIDRKVFLIGFTGFEKWLGTVKTKYTTSTGVAEWAVGFDAGDLAVDPLSDNRIRGACVNAQQ